MSDTLFPTNDDELLISVYQKQGRTLDDLPYTPQFEAIYLAVVGAAGVPFGHASDFSPGSASAPHGSPASPGSMSRQQLFHHLHNLRKAGKLPRLGRASSKPPRVDPKHETLLTQLVEAAIGKLSLRDQLLYTPRFDDIVAAFNERAGLNLSAHDVWRVVAKLAK